MKGFVMLSAVCFLLIMRISCRPAEDKSDESSSEESGESEECESDEDSFTGTSHDFTAMQMHGVRNETNLRILLADLDLALGLENLRLGTISSGRTINPLGGTGLVKANLEVLNQLKNV